MTEISIQKQVAAINGYIAAVQKKNQTRPRGKSATTRIAEIDAKLAGNSISPIQRLQLIQRRIDLENHTPASTVDMGALEDAFVAAAKEYSTHKGISGEAWLAAGIVPKKVLVRAGLVANRSKAVIDAKRSASARKRYENVPEADRKAWAAKMHAARLAKRAERERATSQV
jgi:hypothetical protein